VSTAPPVTVKHDFASIRRAHSLESYCAARGIQLKRSSGGRRVALCPLQSENTPSFTVSGDVFHCYGCGKHGDVVDLERALGGGSVADAIARLGDAPVAVIRRRDDFLDAPATVKREQVHPDLERPTTEDLSRLADLRSVEPDALQIAVDCGFLWTTTHYKHRAFVVTDQTRKNYRLRRLDGKRWETHTGGPKAICTAGSQAGWPIGLEESRDYLGVALCEGETDFLAAFGHMWASGVERLVAPVCITGASNRLPKEAIASFIGKRVRIFVHDDPTGYDAAIKWKSQLAGIARVDRWSFRGLRKSNGEPVKDLNDLLLIDYDQWEQHRKLVDSVMSFAVEGRN
jgi:hypothetical protein